MANLIAITLALIVATTAYLKLSVWRKNYKIAQATGFPTYLSPVYITDVWWLMLYPYLRPCLSLLPRGIQGPWVQLSQTFHIWKAGYNPYRKTGDNVLLSSPNGNMLWTCDASVIQQLFTLHTVQAPVDMLKFYDIWGPTIGSVEGEEWKTHHKALTYGLKPSNQPTVWKESIHQTQKLINRWSMDDYRVSEPNYWTSRLALHVITTVFFDLKLEWKDYYSSGSPSAKRYQTSFPNAIFTVLARMGLIFVVPRALLRILPFKSFQEAYAAITDLTKYMRQLYTKTTYDIERVAEKKNKTILESIAIAGTRNQEPLSEASVFGNLFFSLMAGHETSGSVMAFMILLLAVYPEHQKGIQKQLDSQLGTRTQEEWSMEKDFNELQKGYLGAVFKEVMRHYNPAQFIFRVTTAPTTLHDSEGIPHIVPANTTCLIHVAAVSQNPKIWSRNSVSEARRSELHHSQAIDFNPLRWLEGVKNENSVYFPFGTGPRKCPGMPFAQAEIIAVMCTIFKDYSIELVVSEETLRQCGGNEKSAWERTRDNAIRQLQDDIGVTISIHLMKELPVRLVKRTSSNNGAH